MMCAKLYRTSFEALKRALSLESEFGEPVTGIKTLIHASPNSDVSGREGRVLFLKKGAIKFSVTKLFLSSKKDSAYSPGTLRESSWGREEIEHSAHQEAKLGLQLVLRSSMNQASRVTKHFEPGLPLTREEAVSSPALVLKAKYHMQEKSQHETRKTLGDKEKKMTLSSVDMAEAHALKRTRSVVQSLHLGHVNIEIIGKEESTFADGGNLSKGSYSRMSILSSGPPAKPSHSAT
ncbi:hypothetical protein ACFE04_019637 [Oxalis oulophora]